LSEETLVHRLDLLLAATVVDPVRLVADLPRRPAVRGLFARLVRFLELKPDPDDGALLALDWTGAQQELLVGRHSTCAVRLAAETVSRRHARLVFRDGGWVIQDLGSKNGTFVNGVPVGRCRLRPGDTLTADQVLRVD
jgi:hypothetical protein